MDRIDLSLKPGNGQGQEDHEEGFHTIDVDSLMIVQFERGYIVLMITSKEEEANM